MTSAVVKILLYTNQKAWKDDLESHRKDSAPIHQPPAGVLWCYETIQILPTAL